MYSLTNHKGNTSHNGISITEDFTKFDIGVIEESKIPKCKLL